MTVVKYFSETSGKTNMVKNGSRYGAAGNLNSEALIQQIASLARLPRGYRKVLAAAAEIQRFAARQQILSPSAQNNYVLFLVDGVVRIKSNTTDAKIIRTADSPLNDPIFAASADVTVDAIDATTILKIPYGIYQRELLRAEQATPLAQTEVKHLDNWDEMDGLERALTFGVLAHIPRSNAQRLLAKLREVEVGAGDVLIKQDAPGEAYFIIKSGTAEVIRCGADGRDYRLGVRVPGAGFGEEALITGGKRSATIKMLTDGSVLQFSAEDFNAHLRTPLVRALTLTQAQGLVDGGAQWLDLRHENAFNSKAFPHALNVPATLLRLKRNVLDSEQTYIVYAEDVAKAEVGCYLLAEIGYNAYFLTTPFLSDADVNDDARSDEVQDELLPIIPRPAAPPPSPDPVDISTADANYKTALHATITEIKAAAERRVAERVAVIENKLVNEVATKMNELKQKHATLTEQAATLAQKHSELDRREKERKAFLQAKTGEIKIAVEKNATEKIQKIERKLRARYEQTIASLRDERQELLELAQTLQSRNDMVSHQAREWREQLKRAHAALTTKIATEHARWEAEFAHERESLREKLATLEEEFDDKLSAEKQRYERSLCEERESLADALAEERLAMERELAIQTRSLQESFERRREELEVLTNQRIAEIQVDAKRDVEDQIGEMQQSFVQRITEQLPAFLAKLLSGNNEHSAHNKAQGDEDHQRERFIGH